MTRVNSKNFSVLARFGSVVSLSALTLALGLGGCVSRPMARNTIAIESDPTGMRVEVNGEDLGKTPTSYTVRTDKKGNFAGSWGESPSVIFKAFPPEGEVGLYKQIKSFSPSAFMEAGDRVPARVFFDMHLEAGR
jgi:hypothetical protein